MHQSRGFVSQLAPLSTDLGVSGCLRSLWRLNSEEAERHRLVHLRGLRGLFRMMLGCKPWIAPHSSLDTTAPCDRLDWTWTYSGP